jgi:hypothetical protein
VLAAKGSAVRLWAAKLLHEWGESDPQLLDALRSWLAAEDPWLRSEAAQLLQEIAEKDDEIAMQMARMIAPDPLESLAACRRITHQEKILANDVAALIEIARIRENDTVQQSTAREWLFEWLWRRLEPKERQEQATA